MNITHAHTVYTAIIDYGFDGSTEEFTTATEGGMAWGIELALTENRTVAHDVRAWVAAHPTGGRPLTDWLTDYRTHFEVPYISCYAISPNGVARLYLDDQQ